MTLYVLAGDYHAAVHECTNLGINPWSIKYGSSGMTNPHIIAYVPSSPYVLEGRNIQPGDEVIFGYGTTADMIDRFVAQADSRGTKLSDLRILTK